MKTIGFIFGCITIISFTFLVVNAVINPTPENISQVGTLIAQASIPWWITVMEFLSKVGGTIGGIAIVVFLFLLSKSSN
jgi:hypothetical protein